MTGPCAQQPPEGIVHLGRLDIARALIGNRVDLASATREQSLANPEPIIRFGTPSHGRAAGRVDDQIGGYVRASTMDCSPADRCVHKSQLDTTRQVFASFRHSPHSW
jgi:hypothetical protein